jgi:hypothetical protein
VTFTAATDVVGAASHRLSDGDSIIFSSVNTTTGITANLHYFVINATQNEFQVSTTLGGTAVNLVGNGTGSYTPVTDVLEFTSAGTIADADFTSVTEFEYLYLADGTNTVELDDQAYDGGNGIVWVQGGAGIDSITTYADEAQRAALTVNLRSDASIDTVVLRNNALTSASGTLSGGGIVTTGAVDVSRTFSAAGLPVDFVYDASGQNYAVEIRGFVSGDGGDKLDIVYNSDTSATSSTGSFANSYDLGDPDPVVAGMSTGGVIEISSANYQLSSGWNLYTIAGVLSANGLGNGLVQLDDGEYTVVVYDGTSSTASAHLFNIRVDDEDGLDFSYTAGQNEGATATGGLGSVDDYSDLDAIEYVGILYNIGADSLTGQNFI